MRISVTHSTRFETDTTPFCGEMREFCRELRLSVAPGDTDRLIVKSCQRCFGVVINHIFDYGASAKIRQHRSKHRRNRIVAPKENVLKEMSCEYCGKTCATARECC